VNKDDTLPQLAPTRPDGRPIWSDPLAGHVDVWGQTDVGLVREENQDQFLIADLYRTMVLRQTSVPVGQGREWTGSAQGKLLLVADGLGGHGGGDIASRAAVDALAGYALHAMQWSLARHDGEVAADLEHALHEAQSRLVAVARRKGIEDLRMGTTVTLAYVVWPTLHVVHAGDSRCYLFRKQLHRLTNDHTLAQELAKQDGTVLAESSPLAHVLVNVVGGGTDELRGEVHRVTLARGDAVLLCTDGLTKHVTDADLEARLGENQGAARTVEGLIAAAKAAGGSDNVTVVLARFV
jgi:protein phosphatase